MSTNKTQNYALHTWEPEDDFLREEFNQNFAAIDAILKGKAEVVFGTYTGNNAEQTSSVGFRPRFLIIGNPTLDRPHAYATGNNIDSSRLRFTYSGFTVLKNLVDYTSTIIDPAINSNGLKYVYIAFR